MNLFSGLKDTKASPVRAEVVDDDGAGQAYQLMPGDDEHYMAHALKLARRGIYTTHPNPAVGCIVVKNGEIVGEGWHKFAGQEHAEVIALKSAGKKAVDSTLYVTLEPCSHYGRTPPCVKAIVKSGVSRVVIATEDPNPLVNRSGISELQQAGINVVIGPGQNEARAINRGFIKRVTTGLPWVTMKIATSLDGNTAMSSGESQWITSGSAREDAHRLRARSSAILTGVGTVLRDDPQMTARLSGIERQPLRVILDTNLSTPPGAKILSNSAGVLIISPQAGENDIDNILPDSVEIVDCPLSCGRIDLKEVLLELGRREVNSVLLEAGAMLNGSMLSEGLVDEVVVYMSPDLLGCNTRGMADIPGLNSISDSLRFEYEDIRVVGRDLRITLIPESRESNLATHVHRNRTGHRDSCNKYQRGRWSKTGYYLVQPGRGSDFFR